MSKSIQTFKVDLNFAYNKQPIFYICEGYHGTQLIENLGSVRASPCTSFDRSRNNLDVKLPIIAT